MTASLTRSTENHILTMISSDTKSAEYQPVTYRTQQVQNTMYRNDIAKIKYRTVEITSKYSYCVYERNKHPNIDIISNIYTDILSTKIYLTFKQSNHDRHRNLRKILTPAPPMMSRMSSEI